MVGTDFDTSANCLAIVSCAQQRIPRHATCIRYHNLTREGMRRPLGETEERKKTARNGGWQVVAPTTTTTTTRPRKHVHHCHRFFTPLSDWFPRVNHRVCFAALARSKHVRASSSLWTFSGNVHGNEMGNIHAEMTRHITRYIHKYYINVRTFCEWLVIILRITSRSCVSRQNS